MSFMWERTGRTWRFHFLTSYVYTVSPSFSVELRVRHPGVAGPNYYNLGKFASLKEAKQAVMTDAEKRVPEAFKHYMADGGPLVRRGNPGDPHNPAVAEATAGYEDFHAWEREEEAVKHNASPSRKDSWYVRVKKADSTTYLGPYSQGVADVVATQLHEGAKVAVVYSRGGEMLGEDKMKRAKKGRGNPGNPPPEEALVRALELVREHLATGNREDAEHDLYRAKVLIEVMGERIDSAYEHGWVDADTRNNEALLAKHKVNYNMLRDAVNRRGGKPQPHARRANPGDPHNPAVAEATAGYEDFHAFSPREVGQLRGLIIPRTICLAGEAVQTLYRSDKWENKKNDYYHDHDPGVKVGRTDEHGQMVAVPAEIAGWSSDDPRDLGLYKLGDCLGFFYRDLDGEAIEAHVSRPLPELYATASRKVLLIIEVSGDAAEVQAILWGGKLCVKDVGIVG
jgi:hypothetical protein